ncbi:MAG: GNAT family N-acetyltransferase [Bacteroidota bacterium]
MKYLLDGEETERLLFRKIKETDFNNWLVFHQDPSTSLYWVEEKGTPEEECKKWYAKQFNRYENNLGGMNALIERSSGKLIGHCGLLVQNIDGKKELEIAYSLLPAYWNKGYATEACVKCRDIAFENKFSGSLISIISVINLPSEKVARKIGMKKNGQTVYNGNAVNIFRIKNEK